MILSVETILKIILWWELIYFLYYASLLFPRMFGFCDKSVRFDVYEYYRKSQWATMELRGFKGG